MSFWDHLEELRGMIFRSLGVVMLFTIVGLCFKSLLFDGFVLAPSRSSFFLYEMLGISMDLDLINIEISAQFFTHLKVSLISGVIVAFPYIVFEIWRFVAPALYANEKSAMSKAFGLSTLLFYMGVVVGYCFVFPVCLNFFINYTVSDVVANTISLNSYISLFSSLVLMIGIVFEFPCIILVLSKLGVVDRETLRNYRRHAIVVLLIISAFITPSDPVSMIVLAMPLYALYEFSILLCRPGEEEEEKEEEEEII